MDNHERSSETEHPPLGAAPAPAPRAPRRRFEPPRVLWTEPFQPVAYGMACGKLAGISEKCNSFPQLS